MINLHTKYIKGAMTVQFDNMPSGVYLVKYVKAGNISVQKLIVK
jgi:hypothetical protein